MKRPNVFFLFGAVALTFGAVAVVVQAQTSAWPFFVEVTPSGAAGIHRFAVPLHVLDKAREDLTDLRLYDANAREMPYALRIRAEDSAMREVEGRMFNQARIGATATEVSVDLGDNPGEHNEIEIETEGMNFRRAVEVEGGDNPTSWKTLKTGDVIFSFGSISGNARSNRIGYSTSRYRFLRVRVLADTPRETQPPAVTRVKVLMSRREQAEITTWHLSVPDHQFIRHNGAPASSWTLDLGGRIPCDRLVLAAMDQSFSRPFEVEVMDDPQNIRLISSGELTKRRGDARELTIHFDQLYARKLRLIVTDHSNPPLTFTQIQGGAPLREAFFELKEPATQPLRLYFGNANAAAPHYDFEQDFQSRLNAPRLAATVAELTNNPNYQPPPLPFTERVPWLIYLVLTASTAALGLILFSLARAATKNNVSEQKSEAA